MNIDEVNVFRCPVCKGLWRSNPTMIGMSCLVFHEPGSCCHYSDILVEDKQLKDVNIILGRDVTN